MTATDWTSGAPGTGQYAEVNGINLYYETHGTGRPLILLHGGLGSGEMFGPVLPALAERHQVIPPTCRATAGPPTSTARSTSGSWPTTSRRSSTTSGSTSPTSSATRSAAASRCRRRSIPGKVRRLVMASANIRRDAIYPEMLAQQGQVSAAAVEFMKDTPMYQLYQRVAPRPEDFPRLLDKIGEAMANDFDFTEEVRGLQVPTLVVAADADMAPPSHYAEVFKLLDGGLRDGGWMGEGRPKGGHALAILPGLTHYNIFSSPLFAAATLAFLDDQPG